MSEMDQRSSVLSGTSETEDEEDIPVTGSFGGVTVKGTESTFVE